MPCGSCSSAKCLGFVSASGTLNALQQLGAALGVAVVGTVFFTVLTQHGFHAALAHSIWWAAGALVIAVAATPLLPKEARAEADLI